MWVVTKAHDTDYSSSTALYIYLFLIGRYKMIMSMGVMGMLWNANININKAD